MTIRRAVRVGHELRRQCTDLDQFDRLIPEQLAQTPELVLCLVGYDQQPADTQQLDGATQETARASSG